MNRIIETDRIFLRPFCIKDIEPFAKICANPNVMRYIGNGQPVGLDIISEKIPEWIALYEKQKYSLMALVLKGTDELIGFCGFINQMVDGDDYIELGYRLARVGWAVRPNMSCARHGAKLGGESPLWADSNRSISLGKGVHREMESEGSRWQSMA